MRSNGKVKRMEECSECGEEISEFEFNENYGLCSGCASLADPPSDFGDGGFDEL